MMKSRVALVVICLAVFAGAATAQVQPAGQAPATAPGGEAKKGEKSSRLHKRNEQCFQAQDRSATQDEIDGLNAALKNAPKLVTSNYFLPFGGTLEVGVREPFDQKAKDPEHNYFAAVSHGSEETDRSFQTIAPAGILPSALSENHPLVRKKLAVSGETLLTLHIPTESFAFWGPATLYVYQCNDKGVPASASQLPIPGVSGSASAAVAAGVTILIYLIAALVARQSDVKARAGEKQRVSRFRCLNPIYISAGADGRASLSKLQVGFFTLIVFGLVLFILLRSGVLTDIPTEVLGLLGIAGIGSTIAKGADAQKARLDGENTTWLFDHGWLGTRAASLPNVAEWKDLFSTDGEFDVYRYQSFIFSLAVGGALLVAGVTDIASFSIPTTILGILGLSQAVYIGGKLATPTSMEDLNKSLADLRTLETQFATAAADPANGAGPIADLDDAKKRAGTKLTKKYQVKARTAALLFQAVLGKAVDPTNLEPQY
jgi:hypothetical protein